jgi:hypothetical protein
MAGHSWGTLLQQPPQRSIKLHLKGTPGVPASSYPIKGQAWDSTRGRRTTDEKRPATCPRISVLYTCFEFFSCFVRMLQVFHMNVSKVDLVLQLVFQMHVSCVSSAFRRILQVLYLNVSKVDMLPHLCLGAPPPPLGAGRAYAAPSLSFWMLAQPPAALATCMRVRSGGGASRDSSCAIGRCEPRVGERGLQVRGGETECRRGRPDIRALALP